MAQRNSKNARSSKVMDQNMKEMREARERADQSLTPEHAELARLRKLAAQLNPHLEATGAAIPDAIRCVNALVRLKGLPTKSWAERAVRAFVARCIAGGRDKEALRILGECINAADGGDPGSMNLLKMAAWLRKPRAAPLRPEGTSYSGGELDIARALFDGLPRFVASRTGLVFEHSQLRAPTAAELSVSRRPPSTYRFEFPRYLSTMARLLRAYREAHPSPDMDHARRLFDAGYNAAAAAFHSMSDPPPLSAGARPMDQLRALESWCAEHAPSELIGSGHSPEPNATVARMEHVRDEFLRCVAASPDLAGMRRFEDVDDLIAVPAKAVHSTPSRVESASTGEEGRLAKLLGAYHAAGYDDLERDHRIATLIIAWVERQGEPRFFVDACFLPERETLTGSNGPRFCIELASDVRFWARWELRQADSDVIADALPHPDLSLAAADAALHLRIGSSEDLHWRATLRHWKLLYADSERAAVAFLDAPTVEQRLASSNSEVIAAILQHAVRLVELSAQSIPPAFPTGQPGAVEPLSRFLVGWPAVYPGVRDDIPTIRQLAVTMADACRDVAQAAGKEPWFVVLGLVEAIHALHLDFVDRPWAQGLPPRPTGPFAPERHWLDRSRPPSEVTAEVRSKVDATETWWRGVQAHTERLIAVSRNEDEAAGDPRPTRSKRSNGPDPMKVDKFIRELLADPTGPDVSASEILNALGKKARQFLTNHIDATNGNQPELLLVTRRGNGGPNYFWRVSVIRMLASKFSVSLSPHERERIGALTKCRDRLPGQRSLSSGVGERQQY